jgi:hypothetical protein
LLVFNDLMLKLHPDDQFVEYMLCLTVLL